MPLLDVFPSFVELLSTEDCVEGVVIVTGSGKIFKWKGVEETFSKERAANFTNGLTDMEFTNFKLRLYLAKNSKISLTKM